MANGTALQYSDIYIVIYRYTLCFSELLSQNTSDFPRQVKNYLLKKKSTTTIPISGQREGVNTVHRPEEKSKAVFFHRKCLLKANEDCDVHASR